MVRVTVLGVAGIYILGGVTFLPLLLVLLLALTYLTSKPIPDGEPTTDSLTPAGGPQGGESSDTGLRGLPPELLRRASNEEDAAAGFFAVCREYVPGGVNGKPPERASPAPSTTTTESPSVYQSMYRSIFVRGKTQSPTLDPTPGSVKNAKRVRNVFFVVLRFGHLMLYDDSEQIVVRHVFSLDHYNIDIFGQPGDDLPEGELWVKRNCIRLLPKRPEKDDMSGDARPLYLFSDNCSEKEDFYHALLKSQQREDNEIPSPLLFEKGHMEKLIRQLHSTQGMMQTRWFNALLGRLFLSLYCTAQVEKLVHLKITKKLSRVPTPNFIQSISIRKINLGDSPPFITNPKLRELTLDGDLRLEADVNYKGFARIEVGAIARIELGQRFKPREVAIVLAVICRSLEGRAFFRVKPPPSNRVWFSFETMPKMDLRIEPIVSSRQITLNLVLRAIDSRLREVIADTIVSPNWDDIPFHDTRGGRRRGGLWDYDAVPEAELSISGGPSTTDGRFEADSAPHSTPASTHPNPTPAASVKSMPVTESPNQPGLARRKAATSVGNMDGAEPVATTSSSDAHDRSSSSTPRAIRSNSFASAASPVVNRNPVTGSSRDSSARRGFPDATAAMKDLSSRSQPTSPAESPIGSMESPSTLAHLAQKSRRGSGSDKSSSSSEAVGTGDMQSSDMSGMMFPDSSDVDLPSTSTSTLEPSPAKHNRTGGLRSSNGGNDTGNGASTTSKRQSIASTTASATAAAKKWGMGFVSKHTPSKSTSSLPPDPQPQEEVSNDALSSNSSTPRSLSMSNNERPTTSSTPSNHRQTLRSGSVGSSSAGSTPTRTHFPNTNSTGLGTKAIGRGQPLPPPGQPLPGPPKQSTGPLTWAASGLGTVLGKKNGKGTGVGKALASFGQQQQQSQQQQQQYGPIGHGAGTPHPPHLPARESSSSSAAPATDHHHHHPPPPPHLPRLPAPARKPSLPPRETTTTASAAERDPGKPPALPERAWPAAVAGFAGDPQEEGVGQGGSASGIEDAGLPSPPPHKESAMPALPPLPLPPPLPPRELPAVALKKASEVTAGSVAGLRERVGVGGGGGREKVG